MIRASLAGLALGWLLWSGIDGAATIAIAATQSGLTLPSEAGASLEPRAVAPGTPLICAILRPESRAGWPTCIFPEVGQ